MYILFIIIIGYGIFAIIIYGLTSMMYGISPYMDKRDKWIGMFIKYELCINDDIPNMKFEYKFYKKIYICLIPMYVAKIKILINYKDITLATMEQINDFEMAVLPKMIMKELNIKNIPIKYINIVRNKL